MKRLLFAFILMLLQPQPFAQTKAAPCSFTTSNSPRRRVPVSVHRAGEGSKFCGSAEALHSTKIAVICLASTNAGRVRIRKA